MVNKNKILRFNPNGLKTKDKTYNHIKKALDKETTNIHEIVNNKPEITQSLKEYLENKNYTVLLCRISIPLNMRIITSPPINDEDFKQFKYLFGLSDYTIEKECTENVGQYYFI